MRLFVSMFVAVAVVLSACSDGSSATTEPPAATAPVAPTTASGPATTSATVTTTSPPTTNSPTTTEPTTAPLEDPTVEITVGIYGGQVEGDRDVAVVLGTPVRIVVAADVMDEVHVHGYDLFADVAPGADAVIEFTADIPGIFEVEMEAQGLELIRLEVS